MLAGPGAVVAPEKHLEVSRCQPISSSYRPTLCAEWAW